MEKQETIGQNIFYRRVSSTDQNIDRQEIHDIEFNKVFDEYISGANAEKRPQLQIMLDYIREGDHVYVYSLDRLARNLLDLETLVQTITSKGVRISFHKEKLSFSQDKDSDPYSKIMMQIMAAFAEFERSIIRQRQREGIEKAKRSGKYPKKLDDTQRAKIKELYATKEYSYTILAKEFKVSRSTIQKIVSGTR